MPNQITPVRWGKPLRKSEVNTLDKVNELVDYINNSDIHELNLIASDQGREVVTGTSTQLAQLEVYGESVQDGTPTPDNPVPVQVVSGINVWDEQWEVGSISSANGENVTDSEKFRSKNYIPMFNNIYYFRCGTNDTLGIRFYDIDKSFINSTAITTNNVVNLRNLSQNAAFFRFVDTSRNTYANDICVNVSNPTINGLYLPYGYIGLKINDEITPIDLQGHTLAGLPDGTRDVLRVDSAGRVWIEQNVGYIASYNSESVGSVYISTTGQLTTGASVYYKLDEPQTIELGTITPPAIPNGSVVEIIATLQPEFTLAWFTENGLPLAINDMRDYVDSKINEVNARIDELHGITRANLKIQSIPVDTENESDTEVTENER